jgi:hypothetical protein
LFWFVATTARAGTTAEAGIVTIGTANAVLAAYGVAKVAVPTTV